MIWKIAKKAVTQMQREEKIHDFEHLESRPFEIDDRKKKKSESSSKFVCDFFFRGGPQGQKSVETAR